jgi:hypothetical protein
MFQKRLGVPEVVSMAIIEGYDNCPSRQSPMPQGSYKTAEAQDSVMLMQMLQMLSKMLWVYMQEPRI